MRFARTLLVAVGLALLLPAPDATAQSFGKNKVHYESLDWAVLETTHLRLHFYAEEESLARQLTAFAETVCVEYDARFRVKFRRPIPFLLYSTHHLFQQTNATPELLTEATGGITELIKGRVLLPHNGSWSRLRWVTRHELAHAYMLEKLAQVMKEHHRSQSWLPPLWFIEGLAEYCGTTWDAEAEGLLRDMVISRMAYPMTRSGPITGSVEMYKEGQSFLLYLASRWGDERVFDLLENAWKADDFEQAFKIVYGESLVDVDDAWFESIKRRYYPVLATASRPRDVARSLTKRSRFNLGPRALPSLAGPDSAVRFCWFAVNDGAVDLMVSEPKKGGGRRERRLLRGGGSPQFESFHLFQNRPSTSREGRIALSSKRGGRDGLFVLDGTSGRILHRFEFRNLVAIHDPSFVPGAEEIVFSGQDYSGRNDLYRATWRADDVRLERLTRDDYDDLDPDVSPDGRWVTFSSDRGDAGGRYALFRLSLKGGGIERVSSPGVGDDRQPVYSPDGRWLAFRSTRGGTSDLWVRSSEPSTEARRVTRLLGPASDPDWTPDGLGLLFTAQEAVTFNTYVMNVRPDSLVSEPETAPPVKPFLPAIAYTEQAQRYQRRLGLDLLQNGVVLDPGLGGAGAGQVAFSDVLGNEQLYLSLSNDSERFGNFWDGWEGGLTYFNQSQRLNYGVGVFRLTQLYDVDFDEIRREKRVGLVGLASYPFNKFTRLDYSVLVRHATDHLLRNGDIHTVDLVSNFVGVVHDNSRWTFNGPSGGTRLNLTAGFTRDMTTGQSDYASLFGEARHYRKPLRDVVFASRLQAQSNLGPDASGIYLGGPSRLRGYPRRTLSGLSTVLVQQEVRFPVVRGLVIAVPAAWEFPTISAAAFVDGAWAWDSGEQDQRGGAGFGIYVLGGYLPALRWNWVFRTSDFKTFERRPVMQFVFGFNY